jgi:hypothetical protein
MNVATAPIV